MVFGTRPVGEGDLIGVPPPKRYLFVSRLNRAMETEIVRSKLESKDISVLEIEKLSYEHSTYNSYKIGVSVDDYYRLLNENNFWSSGVKCEKWRYRRSSYRSQYNDQNSENSDRWDTESYYRNHY